MSTPTTTAKTTTDTPRISGVTTQARAARAAEEIAPSDETLSIMPKASDLFGPLGLKAPKSAATTEEETTSEEETTEEEVTEETEAATEEAEETTEEEITSEEETAATEEEEETTEEEPESEEAKGIKASMQKRIDKLTAQRGDLQTQIDELNNQLTAAKQNPAPRSDTANPLAHITTREELDTALKQARQVKDWALRNRNGGEIRVGEDTRTYDADDVATMLANAERELDAAPERQQWLAQQEQALDFGKQVAPNFFTKGTEHYRLLEKEWAALPAAVKAARPDMKIILMQAIIGGSVLGEQMRKAKGAGPGTPPSKEKPVTQKPVVSAKKAPTVPSGRPAPKAPAKQIEQRKAAAALHKPGGASERDLARALESRLG